MDNYFSTMCILALKPQYLPMSQLQREYKFPQISVAQNFWD